jgi:hypothetical protein
MRSVDLLDTSVKYLLIPSYSLTLPTLLSNTHIIDLVM